jgi:hypothetical protein
MTVGAIETQRRDIPAELEQEILARIDRAGLQICEAELRYKLRWDDQEHGSLLELLDELEREGLIESALHFRLTDRGRAQLPDGYEPPLRYGTGGIAWQVPLMRAGASEVRAAMFTELVGELERRGGGTPRDIATRLGAGWSEDQVLAVLGELFAGGVVGFNDEVGFWWIA